MAIFAAAEKGREASELRTVLDDLKATNERLQTELTQVFLFVSKI